MYVDVFHPQKNQMFHNQIKTIIVNKVNSKPDYIFTKVWSLMYTQDMFNQYVDDKILSNSQIKGYFFTPYQLDFKQYILLLICTTFYFSGIKFYPTVQLKESFSFEMIPDFENSFLVVSLHDGFAHSSKFISQFNRKISTIASRASMMDALNKSGVTSDVNIIKNDQFSLARLFERIQYHDILSVAVDFRLNKSDSLPIYKYISPVLFKFAKMHGLHIVFTCSSVNEDGSVSLYLKERKADAKPEVLASEYISFVKNKSLSERILSVRDFASN